MALPSYWLSVSRKDLAERAIVMRRELEAQRMQKYDSAARYFQNIDIQSSKYRELEQLNSYSTSRVNEESGKDEEAKAMKKAKLNDRKEKLTFLLKTENEELMREMRIKIDEERERDPWNISSLKEQVEELRKQRQAEQKELAERKMYQQWKYNTPYIRELEAKHLQRDVLQAWEDQKKEQERSAARNREEENCFLAELEQQRQKAENAVQELEKKQVVESKKLAKHLQKQMEDIKEKNIESEKLKAEEAELLRYQNIIDAVQERRKQLQEIEKKEVLRISLLRQSKDKLRKMAQEVQRELELDCQMLDYLGQVEARQQQKETSRRKLAMTDVQWMREIISEQQALEKARESELQVLYQEEAARMWEKRDAEWNRERKARDTLMKEILEGLQKQIEEKRAHNFETQEEMLKRREDALNSLYKVNQNAKEEEHKMILEKRQYQNEMEVLGEKIHQKSMAIFC